MKTENTNKNKFEITKLSNIRKLKQDTIRKKHKKAYNIQKSIGKTLKNPLVLKDNTTKPTEQHDTIHTENKTKKNKVILND